MALTAQDKHDALEHHAHDAHDHAHLEHEETTAHDWRTTHGARASNDPEERKKPFAEKVGGSKQHHHRTVAKGKTGTRAWLQGFLNSQRGTARDKLIAEALHDELPHDPLGR